MGTHWMALDRNSQSYVFWLYIKYTDKGSHTTTGDPTQGIPQTTGDPTQGIPQTTGDPTPGGASPVPWEQD